ncbi:MAG TPA: universal stress protein [Thermoplasmata archaeon]|nr:universal stress protein [Thermoplasmata archaeon]
MYRQIVVPVQEPAEVEPLIRFASNLLDPDGEIRVLHIIPTTTLPEVTREWRASVHLVVPAHEAGAALDVKVEPEVRAATDVPGEILETAEAHGADAILLTLRGARGSRNPLVGHTASGILQHARTDVVVVNRLALAADTVPRILVATFRADSAPLTLRVAETLALRHGRTPVTILALESEGDLDETTVDGWKSEHGIDFTRKRSPVASSLLGRRRRLPEVILAAAQRERYGLLIVGEEDDRGGGRLLTRRFLEELFRGAPCPVVAVRR